jgi:hypothetical protein
MGLALGWNLNCRVPADPDCGGNSAGLMTSTQWRTPERLGTSDSIHAIL